MSFGANNMIFIKRVRELFFGLVPGKFACFKDQESRSTQGSTESAATVNPWTQDLERLACYTKEESTEPTKNNSGETKIQILMEQARLEKAKEVLKQQLQNAKTTEIDFDKQPGGKRKTRTTDATIVDGKAWWGQAVATWDPEDAKNLGPQGEIRHPRQHKWFNQ
jgi:hypothetical protein